MAAKTVCFYCSVLLATVPIDEPSGTVLLHLFAAALYQRHMRSAQKDFVLTIPALYIPLPSQFSEMESFIDESVLRYRLKLFRIPPPDAPGPVALPVESVPTPSSENPPNGVEPRGAAKGGEGMRQALELYKAAHPNVQAILVGTRRGDPHGGEL
jgi:FAD synthetase